MVVIINFILYLLILFLILKFMLYILTNPYTIFRKIPSWIGRAFNNATTSLGDDIRDHIRETEQMRKDQEDYESFRRHEYEEFKKWKESRERGE